MKVLVIDDSRVTLLVLKEVLGNAGYEVETLESAHEAFDYFGLDTQQFGPQGVDLIIMGLMMPGIDGIQATRKLKDNPELEDIPVIMITAKTDDASLRESFDAGAADFINKSPNKVELLARVRSLLRLKKEMDHRKEVARQLEAANRHLKQLSAIDALTGIPNRRTMDEFLEKEWNRAKRDGQNVSVVLTDIDSFKPYNDNYGHQKGDETLKAVAQCMDQQVNRSGDMVARYGGEEFAVILGDTDAEGAREVAEQVREAVEKLGIPHDFSKACDHVTLSLGIASMVPDEDHTPGDLVKMADEALYEAKEGGRNRSVIHDGAQTG